MPTVRISFTTIKKELLDVMDSLGKYKGKFAQLAIEHFLETKQGKDTLSLLTYRKPEREEKKAEPAPAATQQERGTDLTAKEPPRRDGESGRSSFSLDLDRLMGS